MKTMTTMNQREQFNPNTPNIYSVSDLNLLAKSTLEKQIGTVWLEGEISNFVRASSGHFYFSLKDDNAQIRAAMFRGNQKNIGFKPTDGQHVLAKAQVTLYAPRGEYQLVIQHLELAGVGQLLATFEALKKKLASEGLFDEALKQPLPPYPEAIGVVTSPTGAAIRDILHVLNRRFPLASVRIYPSLVQGEHAAAQLTTRLLQAIHDPCNEVVLLARGGGSIEDLWAFNDETLARTVAASPIPVVTGVGHETDFTLVDFTADLRAPTPSAAAESVSPDSWELVQWVDQSANRLLDALSSQLEQLEHRLTHLSHRLYLQHPISLLDQSQTRLSQLSQRLRYSLHVQFDSIEVRLHHLTNRILSNHPSTLIKRQREQISGLSKRLTTAITFQSRHADQCLTEFSQRLNNVSPLNTLARGFTITRDAKTKQALRSVTSVKAKHQLTIQFQDGSIMVEPV